MRDHMQMMGKLVRLRAIRVVSVLILSLLAHAACTGEQSSKPFVVRDSAGVQIAEAPLPVWRGETVWHLSEAPSLVIGLEAGDEQYQFYRVFGAARLDDGNIVVGNSGSGELRWYDQNGTFVRSVGGQGAGPGEFGGFSSMQIWPLGPNALAVSDQGNDRVNIYDVDGSFTTTLRLQISLEFPRVWVTGVFADGTWLALAPEGGGTLGGAPGDVTQMSFHYLRFSTAGEFLNSLVQLEDRPRYVNKVGQVTNYPYIPLTSAPLLATYGDDLLVIDGPEPELEYRTKAGDLIKITRWHPTHDRRVQAVWERFKDHSLAGIQDDGRRRQYARLYEQDLPLPQEYPAAQQLLVDGDGNMWIQRYRLPWEAALKWDVIDTEGQWLGTVETPPRVRVMHIGDDFVLGRHHDELNVERIHLYSLTKP